MSTFRPPRTTWYLPDKQFSASSRSGMWSRVDRCRYAPISGICWYLKNSLQITTFGPWKHVDSEIHPSRRSCNAISPPPPVLPQLGILLPWIRRLHTLGGCNKTPRTGYLSTAREWGCSYLSRRQTLHVEGRKHICPKCCTSQGWVPWGGAARVAAVAAQSEGGNHHDVLVG